MGDVSDGKRFETDLKEGISMASSTRHYVIPLPAASSHHPTNLTPQTTTLSPTFLLMPPINPNHLCAPPS